MNNLNTIRICSITTNHPNYLASMKVIELSSFLYIVINSIPRLTTIPKFEINSKIALKFPNPKVNKGTFLVKYINLIKSLSSNKFVRRAQNVAWGQRALNQTTYPN
jgi:hypothetical protein